MREADREVQVVCTDGVVITVDRKILAEEAREFAQLAQKKGLPKHFYDKFALRSTISKTSRSQGAT